MRLYSVGFRSYSRGGTRERLGEDFVDNKGLQKASSFISIPLFLSRFFCFLFRGFNSRMSVGM